MFIQYSANMFTKDLSKNKSPIRLLYTQVMGFCVVIWGHIVSLFKQVRVGSLFYGLMFMKFFAQNDSNTKRLQV